MSGVELLRRPRRVVTLPPMLRGDAAIDFAWNAQERGAEVLEVRTDLHEAVERIDRLASALDVLVAQRGRALPDLWLASASLVDIPLEDERPPNVPLLLSHHASQCMSTEEAVALWESVRVPAGAKVKHVEPIATPEDGVRLIETQAALRAVFGSRVTVLGTGKIALPFRCVLARRNALDYLAVDPRFVAAPGQRMLDDALREVKAGAHGPRRGILGHRIAHSRSPRIHSQPFDRIDLPPDAPVGEIVDALRPWYSGFAVTSPFKQVLARHVGGAGLDAVNTLVRQEEGWRAANTDVAGARAMLEHLGAKRVTVLGEGGASSALRAAASQQGVELQIVRREGAPPASLGDAVVWTWPDTAAPPEWLSLSGSKVAVIAYGAPARRIASEIRRLGGVPVRLGPRWFVAQARAQRQLWESAT